MPEKRAAVNNLQNVNHAKNLIPLSEVSTHVQKAVIAVEDKTFYNHPGFSIRAILAALWADIRQREWRYDGSTITQQLVKNSLLTSDKNFLRKYQEFVNHSFEHGQEPKIEDFWPDFFSATFENWQSEFLQLLAFVVLTTYLIHKNSPESRDSQDKLEKEIQTIKNEIKALRRK